MFTRGGGVATFNSKDDYLGFAIINFKARPSSKSFEVKQKLFDIWSTDPTFCT